MSKIKKLLALTLALAMVLSVSAFAGYKVDSYKDATAIDADCKDAIELMYALEIMKGDDKGNFNPEATITRAEVVKMIYVILNYGNDDKAVNYTGAKFFSDVEAGAWYEGYVNYAYTTKLVQGRGNGTFGPTDPITCAEAAKMLLTAIGYSADARGYVGANWAQNVLSDAAILGLLEDYGYNTNTYAPRQWVAVMFANALDCLTFATMAPSVNGLLVNSAETGYDTNYPTMGLKYYGLKTFESVAIATPEASIDEYDPDDKKSGDEVAFATEYVLFANGKEIKNTGLTAMDLGQEYKVIYSTKNNKAYSVRSLSDVAEARLMDMEVEVKYGTSANKAQNKYEFTIDGMVAKFADKNINVLRTGNLGYADAEKSRTGATTLNVVSFYSEIDAPNRNADLYKAIDVDCDGDIDYMVITEYDYAQVSKVAEHNKYGEYIKAGALTFNGGSNLYLEDCIITDDEIAEDDIVKYTWDLDEGKFAMEVLPTVEDVVYEARDNAEKIYTIGGEDYSVSGQALTRVQEWLDNKKNLDEEICLVVDGDLIVYHWFNDSNLTDIADVNAKLALVIDVDATYSTGTLHEKQVIEYMTIDGEKHIAEYQNKASATLDKTVTTEGYWAWGVYGWYFVEGETYTDYYYVQFDELLGLAEKKTMTEDDLEGRLFIIREGTQGRVYLEELDNATINDQLDASTSLLNEYDVVDTGKLDATGSSVKLAGNTMAADNSFFYAYIDEGDAVYGIITPAEFGKGYDLEAYAQTLNYVKSPSGKTTVLAGYIVADLTTDTSNDYLYITEIGRETSDGVELTIQKLGAEETEVIYYEGDAELALDVLYRYTYKKIDAEYVLSMVDDLTEDKIVAWYDEEYTEAGLQTGETITALDVSDDDDVDHIVVVTIEYVRDETQSEEIVGDDADYLNGELYDEYDRTLEVIAVADLTEDAISSDADTDSYEQTAYYMWDGSADVLYVVVLRDMTQAQ